MDEGLKTGIKTGVALIIFMIPVFWVIHKARTGADPVPAPPTPPTRMEAGKPVHQPGMEKPHKYEVMLKNDSGRFINNVKFTVYAWTVEGAEEKALFMYGPNGEVEWIRKFNE